jgi:dolichyl-phosphate-mannose-protein mannosyltransferase
MALQQDVRTPEAGPVQTRRRRTDRRARVLIPLVLGVATLGIRLWDVTSPPQTYWDETYYAIDASGYLGGILPLPVRLPAPTIEGEVSWEHPPLGKWIIATGVSPLGLRPLGYRLPSVIFGTAGVLVLYLLAMELWGSPWWAGLAGTLLSLDGLHIVQSRIAMLDIFLVTFITAGAVFLVRDRKRLLDAAPERPEGRIARWFWSKDRLLAGVMLGAAVATKWSGAFALVLGAAMTASWIRRRTRNDPVERRRQWRGLALAFGAVPIAIYLVSYVEFFAQHPFGVGAFAHLQWAMLQKQLHGPVHEAANSSAWTWPLLLHPIRYFPGYHSAVLNDRVSGWIVAIGNPAFFAAFLLLLPKLIGNALKTRDWPSRFVLLFYGAMYLPWLAFSRASFLFYIVPCLPFMALGIVAALRSIRVRLRTPATIALVVGDLACAAVLMPVWLGLDGSLSIVRALHLLPV